MWLIIFLFIIVILISIVSFKIEEGRERKLFIVNLRFNLFILCINIKVIVVFLGLVLEWNVFDWGMVVFYVVNYFWSIL